jgi:hypothetical protein
MDYADLKRITQAFIDPESEKRSWADYDTMVHESMKVSSPCNWGIGVPCPPDTYNGVDPLLDHISGINPVLQGKKIEEVKKIDKSSVYYDKRLDEDYWNG